MCAEHVVLPRYPVTSLCPPANPISSQDLFKLFKLFASLNYTPQTPCLPKPTDSPTDREGIQNHYSRTRFVARAPSRKPTAHPSLAVGGHREKSRPTLFKLFKLLRLLRGSLFLLHASHVIKCP